MSDIESVAHRVVDAAVSRLKEEFSNVVEAATKEMKQELIKTLTDFDNRLESVENRVTALEADHEEATDLAQMRNEVDLIRAEVRESIITANDSEQQSRGNNIRIRGLAIKSDQNCHQAVLDFIQQKLCVPNIQLQDIEQAHPIRIRATTETVAEAASNNTAMSVNTESRGKPEPSVFVKFRQRYHRDLVLRQRRTLKGSRYTVMEDLTALNVKTLNRARNHDSIKVTWTWSGKIYAITNDNRKLLVRPFQMVQDCVQIRDM